MEYGSRADFRKNLRRRGPEDSQSETVPAANLQRSSGSEAVHGRHEISPQKKVIVPHGIRGAGQAAESRGSTKTRCRATRPR